MGFAAWGREQVGGYGQVAAGGRMVEGLVRVRVVVRVGVGVGVGVGGGVGVRVRVRVRVRGRDTGPGSGSESGIVSPRITGDNPSATT